MTPPSTDTDTFEKERGDWVGLGEVHRTERLGRASRAEEDWNDDDDDDDDDGRRRAEVTCARGEAREARSSARVRRARTRIVVVRRRRRAGGFRSIRVVHSFIPFIHSFIRRASTIR